MLSSFEVKQFRGFSQLRIDRLANVNLIIGRNNVGKTMLLEALRLYAMRGSPVAIEQLLADRDEVAINSGKGSFREPPILGTGYFGGEGTPPTWKISDQSKSAGKFNVPTMFYQDGQGFNGQHPELTLGPSDDPMKALVIRICRAKYNPNAWTDFEKVPDSGDKSDSKLIPALEIVAGRDSPLVFPIDFLGNSSAVRSFPDELITFPPYLRPSGLSNQIVARWWDSVSLRESEERVEESLRIIAPVERVSFVEHPFGGHERIAMVRLTNMREPVPLKSLGDGMMRILQLALGLEYARYAPGRIKGPLDLAKNEDFSLQPVLLVDEIENGLHYSIHADLWRFIIRVARIHGVQVFATSHSWDAILGLREAVRDIPDASVMVIRLEKKPRLTKAVLFDGNDLEVVAREGIEVR